MAEKPIGRVNNENDKEKDTNENNPPEPVGRVRNEKQERTPDNTSEKHPVVGRVHNQKDHDESNDEEEHPVQPRGVTNNERIKNSHPDK